MMKTTKTKTPSKLHGRYSLRYKVCVSGAAETGHCAIDAAEKAELMGKLIAEHGLVLVTGATQGIPYWAAKGAKEAGGIVIGFSPAASEAAHLKTYHLPTDYHDIIIYTGFDYSGRNLILTRSSDAVITICGRMGTLNEFTIAYEDKKPMGVLEKTGGMADMVKEIVEKSNRGMARIIFDDDPERLLHELINMISKDKEGRY
ncbi:MAG TPA: hypothetical protein VJK04_03495 [Candidatus Paceibacterota bacterium]